MLKKILLGSLLIVLSFLVLSCGGAGESTTNITTNEATTEDTTNVEATTTEDVTTTEETFADGTLYVHYFRFDEDYSDWSLWLWSYEPISGVGQDIEFDETDDYGVYASINLNGTVSSVGIIVAVINGTTWGAKDIDVDRYVDLTTYDENGDVHVYLVQNTVDIYYDINDVDLGDRIDFVQFTDQTIIEFTATATVTQEDITVFKNGNPITITDFSMIGTDGVIVIGEAVDLTQKYRLEIDFGDDVIDNQLVRFDGFYDSDEFNDAFFYDGELGAIYSETSTTFKLWAPISESVSVNLYTAGHTASQMDYDGFVGVDNPYDSVEMTYGDKGVWDVTVTGDLDGIYYTYSVTNDGVTYEVVDPYAHSAGVNGKRGMVIDFSTTNPEQWTYGSRPDNMTNYTDAVIYEIHVRDFTSHESWNGTEAYRGKFLGLAERGTTYQGYTTGLDHILDLGVTHVQILPFFDHGIIDETRLNDETYYDIVDGIFNWGYMPENFNVIEGSYSTDPYNGEVRVEELKEMIQTFHQNDLRVIMDVVYNHTGKSADSNFNLILPGYYFRMTEDGAFSNGSGTGNETASERSMVRKYMVDSTVFWASEYNIDGFRFDLMKLHDVDTMNAIVAALHEIDPTIMVYGEPWTGGTTPLPDSESAYKGTLSEMDGVGVFNDSLRDAIKGSVFDGAGPAYVQGDNARDSIIINGLLGQGSPSQNVNYVTAHDNNTLYDKLRLSTSDLSIAELTKMHDQANAIILLSQGIAFLHGGVDIMRTKPCVSENRDTCDFYQRYDHNSYRSPDSTNQIDWQWKVDNYSTFLYYQSLIKLRLLKDVFRLSTSAEVSAQVSIIADDVRGLISFTLNDPTDEWTSILVVFNNGYEGRDYTLPAGTWNLIANHENSITWTGDVPDVIGSVFNGGSNYYLNENDTLIFYSTE